MKSGTLFAGIGSYHEATGTNVWAIEQDKHAIRTYEANHGEGIAIQADIFDFDPSQLENVDILTAGFPCQPFSVAGKKKGFNDPRGNHFMRIMDYVDVLQPPVIKLENVKGLLSHDKGRTFDTILRELLTVGYFPRYAVMNSSEYGNVPQNRERLYIVAFESFAKAKAFRFPEPVPLTKTFKDSLTQGEVGEKYYYDGRFAFYNELVDAITDDKSVYQWRRKYVRQNKSNLVPTLTANMGTGGHNVPLVLVDGRIRKLTPMECLTLQGFNDMIIPDGMADCHLYKQAGNTTTVSVSKRIHEQIEKVM